MSSAWRPRRSDGRVHQLVSPLFDRVRGDARYADLKPALVCAGEGQQGNTAAIIALDLGGQREWRWDYQSGYPGNWMRFSVHKHPAGVAQVVRAAVS